MVKKTKGRNDKINLSFIPIVLGSQPTDVPLFPFDSKLSSWWDEVSIEDKISLLKIPKG